MSPASAGGGDDLRGDVTIRQSLQILRQRWRALAVAAAAVLVLGGVALALLGTRPGVETATARIQIAGVLKENEYYSVDTGFVATEIATSVASALETTAELTSVSAELEQEIRVPRLREMIAAEQIPGTAIVRLSVIDASGDRALAVLGVVQAHAIELAEDIAPTRFTGEALVTTSVLTEPTLDESDDLGLIPLALFVVILAAGVGVAAAFVRDATDPYVRTVADLEFLAPHCAVDDLREAGAVRRVRAEVSAQGIGTCAAVTAVRERGDSAELAQSLAASLANAGEGVLLVAPGTEGITSVPQLVDEGRDAPERGTVVAVGLPEDPAAGDDALSRRALAGLATWAAAHSATVVVQTPSLADGGAALAASSSGFRLVGVVERGRTTKAELRRAIERLERAGAERLTLVLR